MGCWWGVWVCVVCLCLEKVSIHGCQRRISGVFYFSLFIPFKPDAHHFGCVDWQVSSQEPPVSGVIAIYKHAWLYRGLGIQTWLSHAWTQTSVTHWSTSPAPNTCFETGQSPYKILFMCINFPQDVLYSNYGYNTSLIYTKLLSLPMS